MKFNVNNFFINRLLIYPIICSIVWVYVYANYSDFILIQIAKQILTTTMPDYFAESTKFMIFGYVFGYVYGSISIFIKVRNFKGIIFFALFLFKVMQSIIIAGSIGMYILGLEILLFPLIMYFQRRHKKKKRLQQELQKKKEYEMLRDDVIAELKKELLLNNQSVNK